MDNKKLFNRKFLVISVSMVLLVLAGLVLFGYLAVSWKQPQQKVVLVSTVCGDSIINTYNKVSEVRQTGGTFSIDEAGLKSLVAEVKAKKNYQSDATCQTILMDAAIHNQDYNAAKAAYSAVKALHDKHIYVDSNLNTGGSVPDYQGFVQQLAPVKNGNNQEPQGGA